MFVVTLLPEDRLFLSPAEAARLADQVRQDLVCRTADQRGDPVVLTDVPLPPIKARQLVERLTDVLAATNVNWLDEGF